MATSNHANWNFFIPCSEQGRLYSRHTRLPKGVATVHFLQNYILPDSISHLIEKQGNCAIYSRFFPPPGKMIYSAFIGVETPHGTSTILPNAPGSMTSRWARGASARGSSLPTTGRSVPFSSPV